MPPGSGPWTTCENCNIWMPASMVMRGLLVLPPARCPRLLSNHPPFLTYIRCDTVIDSHKWGPFAFRCVENSPRQGTCHHRLPCECFRQEGFFGETEMKKSMQKQPERVVPSFATETEEAAWWYKSRDKHGKQLLAAV